MHAQLGEVFAGLKSERVRDDEIIIFDSTGTGLQDVVAAIATIAVAWPRTQPANSSFQQCRSDTASEVSPPRGLSVACKAKLESVHSHSGALVGAVLRRNEERQDSMQGPHPSPCIDAAL